MFFEVCLQRCDEFNACVFIAVFWFVLHFSIKWSLISVLNLVIFWLLEVSEVTFSSILSALGVPGMTLDVQCPLLIDFWWLWGLKMGAFGTLNGSPGCSWAYFCDPSGQK